PQGLVPPTLPGDGLPLGLRLPGKHRLHGRGGGGRLGGHGPAAGVGRPPLGGGLARGRRGGNAPLRLHPPRAGGALPVPKPAARSAGPVGPSSCGASGQIIAQKTSSCIAPGPVNFPRRPACFFSPRNFIIVLNWNNKRRKVEYYGGKIGQGPAPACYQS